MKGSFDCFKKQINEYNFSNVSSVHYVGAVDKTDEARGSLCNPFFTRDYPEVQQQIVRKSREFREDFTNGINTFKFSPDESPADAFATADALAAVAADELVADALVADELDTGALVDPLTLGVAAGLVVGKVIGVYGTALATR